MAGLLFRDDFAGSGKRFRLNSHCASLMTKFKPARMFRHRRSDSIMLEAILLLLSIGSCALLLIAFRGTNLFGNG